MHSRVHPTYKTKYRVANWASYDRALVERGDSTLWVSPEAIDTWEPVGVGTRGGQQKYSDVAIETALTLRGVGARFLGSPLSNSRPSGHRDGRGRMIST